eukprot:8400177-Ditylum_brightwellii.AAC.1
MSTFPTKEAQSKFPHKVLPRIDGVPTYKAIHDLMMAMYTNTAPVPTKLGDGAHRHIWDW